jgi:RNA polymerase-binding transcription factor DksA
MEEEALKASDQDFSVDHMADHGSDNFEQDFTLALVESERRELFEIDRAILRIEHGTYGVCEGTGDLIPRPRLEAIPWARYSVEYQRKLEAGEVEEDDEGELAEAPEDEEEEESRPRDDEEEEQEETDEAE